MGRDFRRLVVLKAQWYLIDLLKLDPANPQRTWLVDHDAA